ncbi:MAG: hypothetical protein A2Y10_09625 [Planctomycetes bacterium GWF2_41_51]|nr:MAG: hypothetical protein A2Y10_09625 [Planctomycetes bacterium GWF2_41_51]HBG26206.1 hypothetical protein [Phycisphaerales bacterium]
MSALISIIIAVIFGLWGYHKRLYPAWAFLFNVMIAAYLGLMLTPTILALKSAGGIMVQLGPWANSLTMIIITALYLTISQLLSKFYLTNTYCVSFPRWVDNFGGVVLGFLGGYILANIMLFALANTPLKSNSIASKFIPANEGQTLVSTCSYISSFSLQCTELNITKAAQKIKYLPMVAKPVEKKTPIKQDSNQPIPAKTIQPESDKVLDINEQTEELKFRNEIIADTNVNRLMIVQQEVNQPATNQSDINQPATNQPETVQQETMEIVPVERKILDINSHTKRNPLKSPRKISTHE